MRALDRGQAPPGDRVHGDAQAAAQDAGAEYPAEILRMRGHVVGVVQHQHAGVSQRESRAGKPTEGQEIPGLHEMVERPGVGHHEMTTAWKIVDERHRRVCGQACPGIHDERGVGPRKR